MSHKISRRDFLKLVGGTAATVIAAEIATPMLYPERMEFDGNSSPWVPAQPLKNPALTKDIEVDVAIIGGGYTGLSSAWYLLQRYPGKSVAIFEARGTGQGASGRNGGMLLAQTANEYMGITSDANTHKRLYDLTVQNMDDLSEIVKTQGVDIELRRNGVLLVIAKESQVAQYQKYALQAQSLGMPIEFWNRERTINEIGTEVYFASLFDPNAGEVHPMKLAGALKKAAESAGATIFEDSPVFEIQDGKSLRLTVGDQGHKVTSKAVILATNGYTSKLGYLKNSIFPVHTPMATTAQLPDSTFNELGWKNKAGFSDTYTILYHLSRTTDNRIMIGSGHVNYVFNNGLIDKDDPAHLKAHLQKELFRIYPKLAGMEFEYFWSGVLGFSLDFMQSVGVMGEHHNIYYGLGYAGHGVNLSTLFGRVIADLYAGETSQWEGLPFLHHRYIPLPPEPLKWAGIQATIQYYKGLDAAD
jgi:gamma-glutamylputrescine oxidase